MLNGYPKAMYPHSFLVPKNLGKKIRQPASLSKSCPDLNNLSYRCTYEDREATYTLTFEQKEVNGKRVYDVITLSETGRDVTTFTIGQLHTRAVDTNEVEKTLVSCHEKDILLLSLYSGSNGFQGVTLSTMSFDDPNYIQTSVMNITAEDQVTLNKVPVTCTLIGS